MLRLFVVVLSLLYSSANHAGDLRDHFSGVDSFSAEFTQQLFDADQTLLEKSRGILHIQRPDRFYLEYRQPYYQLYVADGKTLVFYDKDLEQVTLKPQKGLLENTPAMILSNPARLEKTYEIKPQEELDGLSWYELIPRHHGGNFDRLSLAFDADKLRIMEMQDSFGQTTRLEFHNIRINPDLDPKLFRFTPPPGVDVIQQ